MGTPRIQVLFRRVTPPARSIQGKSLPGRQQFKKRPTYGTHRNKRLCSDGGFWIGWQKYPFHLIGVSVNCPRIRVTIESIASASRLRRYLRSGATDLKSGRCMKVSAASGLDQDAVLDFRAEIPRLFARNGRKFPANPSDYRKHCPSRSILGISPPRRQQFEKRLTYGTQQYKWLGVYSGFWIGGRQYTFHLLGMGIHCSRIRVTIEIIATPGRFVR